MFPGSYSRFANEEGHSPGNVQTLNPSTTGGVNLDKFLEDVEAIKDDFRELESLYNNLQSANELSKTLHDANSIKDLRSRMDNDVALSLKTVKFIKIRLEALDRQVNWKWQWFWLSLYFIFYFVIIIFLSFCWW